jgi:hypothetical protein
MSVLRKSNRKASSRLQINIKSVKDGVMMLPGNQYRLVLHASSVNFELKSEDEQDALIEIYQSVLNSLVCPIQILICVREMDLDKYIEDFQAKLQNETEDVYRKQIAHYTEFVSRLVAKNKILSRQFYVVLPYSSKEGIDFNLAREQLALNADILSKGLARLGMRTSCLTSLELLDFFYSFYNPRQAKTQPITEQTLQLLREVYI